MIRRFSTLRRLSGSRFFLVAATAFLFIAGHGEAVEVTNADDVGAGSLRDAIATTPASGTVTFNTAFFATARTITLATPLTINKALTVTGPGRSQLTITGSNARQCLNVGGAAASATVEIRGITFINGSIGAVGGGGAAIGVASATAGVVLTVNILDCSFSGHRAGYFASGTITSGGAVHYGSLSGGAISDCLFENCRAGNGGAIAARERTLQIINSTFRNCSAVLAGGAVHISGSGRLLLSGSQFTGNTAAGIGANTASNLGGALFMSTSAASGLVATTSSFTDNSAVFGGAFAHQAGVVSLETCTFANNSTVSDGGSNTGTGAAIHTTAFSFRLVNTTITRNRSAGSAVFLGTSSAVVPTNCVIIGQTTGTDITGSFVGGGSYNYTSTAAGLSPVNNNNITGTATGARLAPLGAYGFATETCPPLPGSPLIDGGVTAAGIPTIDQRNLPNVGTKDIGAVESRKFTLTLLTGGGQAVPANTAYNPVVLTVAPVSGTDPVEGGLVNFNAPTSPSVPSATPTLQQGLIDAASRAATTTLTSNSNLGTFNLVGGGFGITSLNVPLSIIVPPDLNLVGNAVSIPDGDTTPALTDHTDFGSVLTTGGSLTRTFTIQNTAPVTGGSPLTNLAVDVTDRTMSFSLGTAPPTTLAAGATTTFTVIFNPVSNGAKTLVISIASNDPDENPYTFTVTGFGSNTAPTNLNLSATTSAENSTTSIGSLTTVDPDGADTFTYSLAAGVGSTDNAAFTVSGVFLTWTTPPDFEAKSSYAVRLRTTDAAGSTFERAFTITVTNINEAPTFTPGTSPTVATGTNTLQTLTGWATGMNDGDSTVVQTLTFSTTVLSGATLFTTAPSVAANGTLTFRPTGTAGTASVRVTLTDDATINSTPALGTPVTFNINIGVAAPPPVPVITTLTRANNGAITLVWTTVAGRTYRVRHSTDLQTWTIGFPTTAATTTTQTYTDSTITFTPPAPQTIPRRFYRVEDMTPP